MKVILILVGAAGTLYALLAVVQMLGIMLTSDPRATGGASAWASGIVPICLGLVVAVACFQRALRSTQAPGDSDQQDSHD